MGFSLSYALRNLGFPFAVPSPQSSPLHSVLEAAQSLDAALSRRTAVRRHLCPLNLADNVPEVAFGQARIMNPGRTELADLLDAERLSRVYARQTIDLERLAKFSWLVVEETVELDPRPEARAVPILFDDLRRDLGAIDPHLGRFPAAVERALFFLLLAPWEDWQGMHEVDWRGFTVPWVHTVDDDCAMIPARPPTADALSMTWNSYYDGYEEIEVEVPSTLPLEPPHGGAVLLDPKDWAAFEAAQASPLLAPPVRHFMVHAFLADGIDEIMAHLTAIEAALGAECDYRPGLRLAADAHRIKATKRVAARVTGLLRDGTAGADYLDLFEMRSAFVHGRGQPTVISTVDRVRTRRLARRVAAALISIAGSSIASRDQALLDLLDAGRPLLP